MGVCTREYSLGQTKGKGAPPPTVEVVPLVRQWFPTRADRPVPARNAAEVLARFGDLGERGPLSQGAQEGGTALRMFDVSP